MHQPDTIPDGEVENHARTPQLMIKAAVRWILFIIVLAFVGYALSKQIAQVDWATVHFRVMPVLAAGGCLLLVPIVQLISYRTLLGAYAHVPSFPAMAAVAWIPPLGKYVPGKVASLAGAVYLLRRFGIPAAIALGVVLVMDGVAVVSGLVTGSPLLLWAPIRNMLPHAWIWSAIVVGGGIICLHPAVFGRVLNFILRRMKRPILQRLPDLKHYLVPVVCAFAQWALAGTALWFIANSVTSVAPSKIPLFISIAGLGYTISYLMLFAPGGLGPREAIFHATLSMVMGPGFAGFSAISVVLMRLVQTATELTAATVGMIMLRRAEKQQAHAAAKLT